MYVLIRSGIMRINKVFFAYIRKHKKGKVISGILCLLALCMLMLILPNHGVMANETPTTVSTDNEYTVYFDASNYTNDEWITKYGVGIHGFDENGNSGAPYKMNVSDRGDHIYAYTFDRAWSKVIFTKGASWSDVQTENLDIPWSMVSPSFKLTNIKGKECTGEWYDLGDLTPDPNKPTISELDPNGIYLDTSGMNKTINWTEQGSDLYLYISTLPASENNRLLKATGIVKYKGIEFVYWDLSEVTAAGTGNVAFVSEGSWENADSQDYYRTTNIDETTLETAKRNAYYWNGYSSYKVDGVLNYRLDVVDFEATYETDYTKGDSSRAIPTTAGNKETISEAYYATSTFYDYYSDFEMKTGKNKKECLTDGFEKADYKNQFQYFNKMIAQYYRSKSSTWNPLYFGDFWAQKNDAGYKWNDAKFDSEFGFYKFAYYKNNSEHNEHAAYQGLVDQSLTNNKATMGGLEIPYFNSTFLRNRSTPLAAIYDDVAFPFTMNNDGYWEFNSEKQEHAVQLTNSDIDGYYLKRTNAKVNGITLKNNVPTETTGFFPFNDSGQSGNVNKLDYGFGMEMEIPFTLTDDGKINMNGTEQEIVFNFSGDDDIWIFIDGKLVLDIGGDHGIVNGSINFATQKAKVDNVKNSEGQSQGASTTDFSSSLPMDTYTDEHVMKIFYMERGLWESNMKITFNFPERNSIQVEKEVIIPYVDSIFDTAMDNLKNTNFNFNIQNLVTDTTPYTGAGSTEVKEKIFNSYTTSDKNETISKVNDVQASITTKDNRNVISWYAPREKKSTDGQNITDMRLVKIAPPNGTAEQGYIDVLGQSDYLTFETYQNSIEGGSDPFVALVDADGTRIGGWIKGYSYQGNSNAMGTKIWRTMKVDLKELKGKVLTPGSTAGFDFSKVKEIQFAYWNDVTVYISPFTFHKASSATGSSGFTIDLSKINDYGSIDSRKLEDANGATYGITGGSLKSSEYREVSAGTLGLTHGQIATFRNEFRKGSYIAISETGVDPNVFTTRWTLYEDGESITKSEIEKSTTNVQQTKGKTTLSKVPGLDVADGRFIKGAASGVNQPENAIAFYRYDNPDSKKSTINLKAKYTNTLKVGSLTIKKSIKVGETADSNKEYSFKVSFENVAGMALEGDTLIEDKIITLKAGGEPFTIEGIPAGTAYTVKELKEENDEFSLTEIKQTQKDDNVTIDLGAYAASGLITQGDKEYEFVNSVLPTIEIYGEKTWDDNDYPNRPDSITIQLQRRVQGSNDEFEVAKDKNGVDIPEKVVKQLSPDSKDNDWSYRFTALPKYVDYTATEKKLYEYRIMEIKVGDILVEDSDYLPEYDKETHLNITNKLVGKITIKKVDENGESLKGAKFTLEMKTDGSGSETWKEIKTLDMTDLTVGVFDGLERGEYQITEIVAPQGHNILKDPILISLPFTYKKGDVVNGVEVDSDGQTMNVTLTITNVKGSILPTMGGDGTSPFVLPGAVLMIIAAFMCILLKKELKQTKASFASCSKAFCDFREIN